jgi:hypothetical protein
MSETIQPQEVEDDLSPVAEAKITLVSTQSDVQTCWDIPADEFTEPVQDRINGEDDERYEFRVHGSPLEMVLNPSLNEGLPAPDSYLPASKWSAAYVFMAMNEDTQGNDVFHVVVYDDASDSYVVVRSLKTEKEADRFVRLIDCSDVHPNALPRYLN